MGAGISGGKSGSQQQSQSTTNQSGTNTYTPNNLAELQAGWKAAGGLLGTNWQDLINAGQTSIAGAAPGATNLATAAGTTATDFAGGKYAENPANAYLKPYADGSMMQQNPAFNSVLGQFARGAQAATDGGYGAAGRYGSGANANAFDSAVANESGDLSYTNFAQQEANRLAAAGQIGANDTAGRAQQLAGAGMAPSLISSMFTPGTALSAAGYGPLAAYFAALTAGNGGGTTNTQGTSTTDAHGSGTNWNVNGQVSAGTGMTGGVG